MVHAAAAQASELADVLVNAAKETVVTVDIATNSFLDEEYAQWQPSRIAAAQGVNCSVHHFGALAADVVGLNEEALVMRRDDVPGFLAAWSPYELTLVGLPDRRARDVGLWLSSHGSALVVERLPAKAAYPRQSGSARLFVLTPGQMGQYRANFRFTGCACDPSWYYEDWLMHIGNGAIKDDGFVQREPDHDVDHPVHLYGGSRRSAAGGRLQ